MLRAPRAQIAGYKRHVAAATAGGRHLSNGANSCREQMQQLHD
jgi:hypothetical protein